MPRSSTSRSSSSTVCTNTAVARCSLGATPHDRRGGTLRKGVPMIACWRTVVVPDDQRARFLAWIDENRRVREAHGICAEVVLEPRDGGETVVLTIWPNHDAFDAWIATPERD